MSLQEDVIRTMTDPLCSVEHRADKIVSKVLDAAWPDIEIMQQALLEIRHAQNVGPDWYTRGESGLRQQVRMWLDKGFKASEAINKLRPQP